MQANIILKTLVGKQVKALYYDEGKSKKVVGTLKEATNQYLIINDVVVGLGVNFIACIPIKEQRSSMSVFIDSSKHP
jgi:hypothetical protein